MTEMQVKLLDWDRRMGTHSRFPPCCIDEWCQNMIKVDHFVGSDELFGISAEKKAIMGPRGKNVFFVPCMACARDIGAGKMVPPVTHRCLRSNPECVALWREAETLTGYQHLILK